MNDFWNPPSSGRTHVSPWGGKRCSGTRWRLYGGRGGMWLRWRSLYRAKCWEYRRWGRAEGRLLCKIWTVPDLMRNREGKKTNKKGQRYTNTHSISCSYSILILYAATGLHEWHLFNITAAENKKNNRIKSCFWGQLAVCKTLWGTNQRNLIYKMAFHALELSSVKYCDAEQSDYT